MARAADTVHLTRARGQVHFCRQRCGRCGEHVCVCAPSAVRCRRSRAAEEWLRVRMRMGAQSRLRGCACVCRGRGNVCGRA